MSPAAYLKASSVAPPHQCSKVPYASRAAARKDIAKMKSYASSPVEMSLRTGRMHVYHCSVCRNFHVTHNRKGGRR